MSLFHYTGSLSFTFFYQNIGLSEYALIYLLGKVSSKSTMNPAIIQTSCSGNGDGECQLSSNKLPLISKANAVVFHNQKPSIFDPDKQRDKSTAMPIYVSEVSRFVCHPSPSFPRCEETMQHERRSKMQLDGLVPCLPTSAHAWKESKTAGAFRSESGLVPSKAEGRSQDEIGECILSNSFQISTVVPLLYFLVCSLLRK